MPQQGVSLAPNTCTHAKGQSHAHIFVWGHLGASASSTIWAQLERVPIVPETGTQAIARTRNRHKPRTAPNKQSAGQTGTGPQRLPSQLGGEGGEQTQRRQSGPLKRFLPSPIPGLRRGATQRIKLGKTSLKANVGPCLQEQKHRDNMQWSVCTRQT